MAEQGDDRQPRILGALRINENIEECTGTVTPQSWKLIKLDLVRIIALCPGHALPAVIYHIDSKFVPELVALRWFGDVPEAVFELIERIEETIVSCG